MNNLADWVQAGAALASLALTGALIWATWRYVKLTKELVDQNQRALAGAEAKELTRRRGMAVSLRGLAGRTATTMGSYAKNGSLPGNVSNDGQPLMHDIDQVVQLALDVGSGIENHALEAEEYSNSWLRDGRAAKSGSESDRKVLQAQATQALSHAAKKMRHVEEAAAEFIRSSPGT